MWPYSIYCSFVKTNLASTALWGFNPKASCLSNACMDAVLASRRVGGVAPSPSPMSPTMTLSLKPQDTGGKPDYCPAPLGVVCRSIPAISC